MAERRILARLLLGGAGPLAVLTALVGCSGGSGVTSDATGSDMAATGGSAPITTIATSATTAPPAQPAPAAEAATTPAAPAVDGAALLQQALDAIAGGYHFTTTVSVDGATTLVADGDRVADSTRLTITGDAGTIAYVVTPAGAWVLPEDGEWEAVEAPAASVDPIAALWSPTSVDVQALDGSVTTLTAAVPAVSLGITGDAPAVLQLMIDGSELRDITYTSSLDGRPAAVQATITPLVDTSPVIAPV